MMIGGDAAAVKRLDPIFKALAPGQGKTPATKAKALNDKGDADRRDADGPGHGGRWLSPLRPVRRRALRQDGPQRHRVRPDGGLRRGPQHLQARQLGKQGREHASAEVTPLREPEHYQYDFNLPEVAEVWRRGSVVASWLLDLTAEAFLENRRAVEGGARPSPSMACPTPAKAAGPCMAAIEESVPCTVLSAALYSRFASRQEETFAWKVVSAMRRKFGGH